MLVCSVFPVLMTFSNMHDEERTQSPVPLLGGRFTTQDQDKNKMSKPLSRIRNNTVNNQPVKIERNESIDEFSEPISPSFTFLLVSFHWICLTLNFAKKQCDDLMKREKMHLFSSCQNRNF